MCPLRAYGGYPTLVCHLGLKDMQRLGPDCRKTLYMTAPQSRAGHPARKLLQSPKKKIKIISTMSAKNSKDYGDESTSDSSYGGMESEQNSGAEDGAPEGATLDSERSRHGKSSAKDHMYDTAPDSEDSSSHTPAQKSKRMLLTSSPAKSQSPIADLSDQEAGEFDYLSESAPLCKTGFRRQRLRWAPVASWNLEHNTEEAVFQEISRILASSMADAQVSVTPKHNLKAISHFRLKQASACIDLLLVQFCRSDLSESIFLYGRTTSRAMAHTEIESMDVHFRGALDAMSSFVLRS